jgi:hypothetical protein
MHLRYVVLRYMSSKSLVLVEIRNSEQNLLRSFNLIPATANDVKTTLQLIHG